VPSEGKFGVDGSQAVQLLRHASSLGLEPYGVAYHVGSQMTQPTAWEGATRTSAAVLRELQADGITLRMLNIGGGLPARYTQPVPDLADYGACIRHAVDRHLPYPIQLCAEPGRALVAEAGVLVATIIGTAERAGRSWLHLDVGAFNGMMETLLTRNRLVYPLADSRASDDRRAYHITGPTCDSQDTMFFGVPLSRGLVPGDQVYIFSTGAYTTCYASTFNGFSAPTTHCLPQVDGGDDQLPLAVSPWSRLDLYRRCRRWLRHPGALPVPTRARSVRPGAAARTAAGAGSPADRRRLSWPVRAGRAG
jgi:ornithine decarboxylase